MATTENRMETVRSMEVFDGFVFRIFLVIFFIGCPDNDIRVKWRNTHLEYSTIAQN